MQASLIIYCTTPDLESARKIASFLVDNQLAACCNLVPNVESIYRWQDQIEQSTETLILIKSTRENYESIEKAIKDLHPYDVPEIIATSIQAGSKDYLDWINSSVKGPGNDETR